MVTYFGISVRSYSLTAKLITTGGKLTVRAFISAVEGTLHVIGYDDHEEQEKAFAKEFFTVDEFKEWYRKLHIIDEIRYSEIIE